MLGTDWMAAFLPPRTASGPGNYGLISVTLASPGVALVSSVAVQVVQDACIRRAVSRRCSIAGQVRDGFTRTRETFIVDVVSPSQRRCGVLPPITG